MTPTFLLLAVATGSPLVARHQTVVVEVGGSAVVTLRGYDPTGAVLAPRVLVLPETGTTFHLSKVFAKYGYEPKRGATLAAGDATTRFFYERPEYDVERSAGAWGVLEFLVETGSRQSRRALVTLLPPSLRLVATPLDVDASGWTVVRNARVRSATFDPGSLGPHLNRFVVASDDLISRDAAGVEHNSSRWMFEAPATFSGHRGAVYGGSLEFTVAALAGDFQTQRPAHNLVELECAWCGITLAFPTWNSSRFDGAPMRVSIPLVETAGWIRDPHNTLLPWPRPSQCDFVAVLNGLSALRILGDFTDWYESIALDDVALLAPPTSMVPICAMQYPCACSS